MIVSAYKCETCGKLFDTFEECQACEDYHNGIVDYERIIESDEEWLNSKSILKLSYNYNHIDDIVKTNGEILIEVLDSRLGVSSVALSSDKIDELIKCLKELKTHYVSLSLIRKLGGVKGDS